MIVIVMVSLLMYKGNLVWLDDEEDEVCDTASFPVELHPIIRMFLLIWQYISHISDAGMAVLILLHNLLQLLSSASASRFLNLVHERQVPKLSL